MFSDPSFLFYLDFLSRKLSFLCSIYFCSGYHLKFGVLRVFPGQVSFTVNIECSKIMFYFDFLLRKLYSLYVLYLSAQEITFSLEC